MKLNPITKTILTISTLVCILGLSGASLAVPQSGSCPMPMGMGQQHVGHGMSQMGHASGKDMGSSGTDAVAKFANTECSNCHGRYGISTSDDTPNLAGQQSMYMCAWLDGCRKQGEKCEGHEDIAGKLTDQQIIDLSEFFANLPSEKW